MWIMPPFRCSKVGNGRIVSTLYLLKFDSDDTSLDELDRWLMLSDSPKSFDDCVIIDVKRFVKIAVVTNV